MSSDGDFKLPLVPPDFSLMERPRLEDYAANCDWRLRGTVTEDARVSQIVAMSKDMAAFFNKEKLKIRPREAQLILILLSGVQDKKVIHSRLYSMLPCDDDIPAVKVIDVFMANVRPFMAALGSPIETLHARGYRLNFPNEFTLALDRFVHDRSLPAIKENYVKSQRPRDKDKLIIAMLQAKIPPMIIRDGLQGVNESDMTRVKAHCKRHNISIPSFTGADISAWNEKKIKGL